MDPLAAFQVLIITMAAAMFVEAVKSEQKAKPVFWTIFGVLGLLGVATNIIASAWPIASSAMVWIGSSPITFLIFFLGWVALLQKPWRRSKSSATVDLANLGSAEGLALAEKSRKLGLSVSELCHIAEELRERISGLEALYAAEVTGLKEELESLKQENTEYHSLKAEALKAKFDEIYMALAAVGNRERLNYLADQIEKKGDALSAPTIDPEFKLDEIAWELWTDEEEEWRDKLSRWCELAEPYKKGVTQRVFSTPEHQYRAKDWKISDGQFPPTDTSNAVHAYKSFRIILSNWKNEWGNVNWRMSGAAFQGQAASILRGEHD
jgi:hypothetical protein